ncbi:class I SAM-dependent methyltransferase [Halobacteriovorax sp. GB3]|uniref:class I SAM-dependent methyltransferase n=1 Tax=Halobacteriovorax sp. GB3 TaxID=2719615 RepID=UPI00235FA344|nr:class I SAM-dependent methyltransferase [Halobacteriovorax sp. GB3]MDD0852912.1 class I SAM-dependent methyltransferase [Halobacteriovorax sp. GB3]
MNKKTDFPYLHGFNQKEQDRLRMQSRFTEYSVYQGINFSGVEKLLEVGCGVGAQTEILLRRFPDLHVTGIDRSTAQLQTATDYLNTLPYAKDRFDLLQMDATNLNFAQSQFDGAFLCWVLEHIPDPAKVLSEVRRVLRPGSRVYITEVLNSSFFLEPYSPNVWKYWMAFNDYQYDMKGDPFIGAKLGNILLQQGFRDIKVETKTWHLDNRRPQKRKEYIDFWHELLLSAADQLLEKEYVDEQTVEKAKDELQQVANDPNAVFYYSYIQAKATVY